MSVLLEIYSELASIELTIGRSLIVEKLNAWAKSESLKKTISI
jgi:hypothetical protein